MQTLFCLQTQYRQNYYFSSSHVWMWELDNEKKKRLSKEELMPSNYSAGENSWKESPLDSKKIKPVNPKGYQPWIFTGRNDAEAEAPIFWPPDAKSRLIRKDPDTWKVWRQKKGMTEGDMVGWHHWLNEHEFEQAPGDGAGQGSLACCSPWGHKESDTTEWLNSSNDCFFFLSKQFITTCIIWILFYNSNLGNYFQSHLRSPKRKLILSLYNHNSEKMDSGDCD